MIYHDEGQLQIWINMEHFELLGNACLDISWWNRPLKARPDRRIKLKSEGAAAHEHLDRTES